MKTKSLFLTGLIGLGMLTACSNDDDLGQQTGNQDGEEAYAQISINIMNNNASPSTRAVTGDTGDSDEGTAEEYGISDIMVVLTGNDDIATHVYKPGLEDTPPNDDTSKRATKTFKIPAGSYKVYVLANYDDTALSPIIQNTTDMKGVFSILNAGKLSTGNKFLMVNAKAPTAQTIDSNSTTTTEFDDDGNAKNGGQDVVKIEVDIERVVAKVTFDQTNTTFPFRNVSDKKIGEATIKGVGIINLNKKMNLVGDKTVATNWPTLGNDYSKTDDTKFKWYYPTDPNYETVIDDNNSSTVLADFDQASVPDDGFKELSGIFYTPENTMAASAQQNGQTTGVVYKVEFDFSKAETGETPYTELKNTGSDAYSTKFQAAINENNTEITANIFMTPESEGSKTFYTWNGLIFISKNAAALYKAIVESAADANGSTIVTSYTTNKNSDEISSYIDGIAYYPVWIKHNPDSQAANEQDKYGVVRNHWYELTVTSIKNLGYTKPSYDPTNPEKPDDDEEALIQVLSTIKPWRLVKQNVDL